MTPAAIVGGPGESTVALPRGLWAMRASPRTRWLGHPLSYTIGTTVASFLSIGTSLLAPSLLGPAAFGSFALLTSLFQYASRFDFGLSQLADREIAAGSVPTPGRDRDILFANWLAGVLILVVITPLAAIMASFTSIISSVDTALAVGGGALAMIANAPVTIFRAGAQIWEFTAVALTLQAGMTLPRLAGLVAGGITGCFAVLVAWYAILALIFARPSLTALPRPKLILSLWRAAFPLFLFNALWLIYLTANRWIASFLTTPEELGYFAFGANLAFVGLGMISTIAQVYYPRLLSRIVQSSPGTCSRSIELQSLTLGLLLTGVALAAILVARDAIAFAFPRYLDAASATVVLALSCLPLGLATWLFPICIALSTTPKRDALRMFLPAFSVLVLAMAVGHLMAGTEGLAWGCVVGGISLLVSVVRHLTAIEAIRKGSALRIISLQLTLCAVLAALALSILPAPRSGLAAAEPTAAAPVGPPLGWRLAFEDNFDSLRLWDAKTKTGTWEPHYPWKARTNPSNSELQYYVDPRPGQDPDHFTEVHPFTIDDNKLAIRARPLSPNQKNETGLKYASGLLTSEKSFSFTYGYVEIRAKIARGRGLWSAFWLAPLDHSWPPEIDVIEALGHDTKMYVKTAHTSVLGFHSQSQFRTNTPDLADAYHTYAVKWSDEEIIWYFEGRQVASTRTPGGADKPMYLIVNLAVGGNWPGSPDESTLFPAALEVDYIRVYLPPDAAS